MDDIDDIPDSGRFIAFFKADAKQAGRKGPDFEGTLTLPGGEERRVGLWARKTKAGKTMLSGRLSRGAVAQIEELTRDLQSEDTPAEDPQSDGAQFAVDPHDIVLFRASKPDGSKLPDYWGYCHPGGNAPLMKLSVWAKTDKRGRAMLSGAVAVHEPAKDMQAERQRRRARARG
ncbi:MAG: hypothetical protein NW215_03945 [Hyphomicrobiales bacterium]|nr:hypothetical protein [Hyphomicrobiales bacterium]